MPLALGRDFLEEALRRAARDAEKATAPADARQPGKPEQAQELTAGRDDRAMTQTSQVAREGSIGPIVAAAVREGTRCRQSCCTLSRLVRADRVRVLASIHALRQAACAHCRACDCVARRRLLGCGWPSAPAPPQSRIGAQSAAAIAQADEQQARATCGGCHAFPPPDILPRQVWRDEFVRMMFIRENRLPPLGPPATSTDGPAAARHGAGASVTSRPRARASARPGAVAGSQRVARSVHARRA